MKSLVAGIDNDDSEVSPGDAYDSPSDVKAEVAAVKAVVDGI